MIAFLYNETYAIVDGIPTSDYILYEVSVRGAVDYSCFAKPYMKVYNDKFCVRYEIKPLAMCSYRTTTKL
jgi:hypothetical protein